MTLRDPSLPHDQDWMLVRELLAPVGDDDSKAGMELHCAKLDPKMLTNRTQRKSQLPQHPRNSADEKEPWLHMDRAMSKHFPEFSDPMWSFGAMARWVIERTPQAVDGLSISQEKLLEILPEIQAALSSGEVSACAVTMGDPIPRDLPAATWSIYTLSAEFKNGFIRIFSCNTGSDTYDEKLLHLRVRPETVLERWPANSSKKIARLTTTGAENECRRWLCEMMRRCADRPKAKPELRDEALAKFVRLSLRGFERAWQAAIRETGASNWKAPGRRAAV